MKIVAGNWKMNGSRVALDEIIAACDKVNTSNKVILCVPFTMLHNESSTVLLGAQDVSTHDHGAYTGEISAQMLKEVGAQYVIVGHSERRTYHNESNATVAAKATAALSVGLTPIICVGETMDEKKAGRTMEIIESGVRESVPNTAGDIIIAYEPRWAIGAGLTPTDAEIETAHTLIANILSDIGRNGTPVLYGASVNGTNAAKIMSIPHVDGVLVGGASLKSDDFIPIITSVK